MGKRAKENALDEKTLAALKKLFADYDKAEKAYDDARTALVEQGAKKVALVQKIAEIGGIDRTYVHGGRKMMITKREYKEKTTTKQPDGTDTETETVTSTSWFFRAPKDDVATII